MLKLRLRTTSPGTLGAHQVQQHRGISRIVLASQCTSGYSPESNVLRALKLAASENRGKTVDRGAKIERVLTVP